MHDLRGLRPAVPGRHRARRSHPRPAPVPGDDGIGVPERAQRAVQRPGEQGKSVVDEPARPDGLGEGSGLRGPGRRQGRRGSAARWTTCSGWAAPARTRTGPRRPPERWPSCCTPPASRTRCWATARRAPAIPARRAGNEFVFQQLAMENVETLKEAKATKIVTSCAHCLNTLKNEYPQLGPAGRGGAPHPAAQPAGPRRPADARRPARGFGRPGAPSPTTTRAISGRHNEIYDPPAGTARRSCPARPSPRCRATGNGPSAAGPAGPGCGWRRSSAPGSTTTGRARRCTLRRLGDSEDRRDRHRRAPSAG